MNTLVVVPAWPAMTMRYGSRAGVLGTLMKRQYWTSVVWVKELLASRPAMDVGKEPSFRDRYVSTPSMRCLESACIWTR